MNVMFNLSLMGEIRYRAKRRRMYKEVATLLDGEDLTDFVESTEKVLVILPPHLREGLIDTLLQKTDELRGCNE